LEVEESIWKEGVRKNASVKSLGSHNRVERGVYTKERKSVFVVKRRKGGGTSVHGRSIAKEVHPFLQITTNITSTLCGKKGWEEEDSTRLSSYKPIDDKKWISLTTYRRYTGWSREEKGVYEVGSEMGLQ